MLWSPELVTEVLCSTSSSTHSKLLQVSVYKILSHRADSLLPPVIDLVLLDYAP